MKNHWVISPYISKNQEAFDRVWKYDLENGTIAVGWRELGNIFSSKLSEDEYKKKYIAIRGKDSQDRMRFWSFYNEISIGDMIIARKGAKRIVGKGEVIGKPFYDENKGKERVANLGDVYSNFINVKWEEWEKKEIKFDRQVFPQFTIWKVPDEKKYDFLTKGEISEQLEEQTQVEEQQGFILEKHLEDFIVSNLENIFDKKLKLYKDDEERTGQQYPTGIGNIDILAREPETNSLVVIELKKGRESDKVVGQILRYMGWVKENITGEGESVKGLIICKERDEKLDYSLKAIPGINIGVRLYKVDFRLVE